jgi:hypothetical protein
VSKKRKTTVVNGSMVRQVAPERIDLGKTARLPVARVTDAATQAWPVPVLLTLIAAVTRAELQIADALRAAAVPADPLGSGMLEEVPPTHGTTNSGEGL